MRHKQFTLSVVLLLKFGLTGLFAQEAITASGGDATDSSGSVSYSVGQVFYTTKTGINGSSVEGLQQPYEISVETAIEQAKDINLICTVYPNPVTYLLFLEVEISKNENLYYQLYNMNGKLFESKKIIDNRTTIVMSNLVSATYFLKVTDNRKVVKIFKIIKKQ